MKKLSKLFFICFLYSFLSNCKQSETVENQTYSIDSYDNAGNFALRGRKWSKTKLTYAIRLNTIPSYLDRAKLKIATRQAFDIWQSETSLVFTEVDNLDNADIKIGFFKGEHGCGIAFDGTNSFTLGHGFYPPPTPNAGEIHLNNDIVWTLEAKKTKGEPYDYITVTAHEIGHTLGLMHSDVATSVMHPNELSRRKLDKDDLDAICKIYPCTDLQKNEYLQPNANTGIISQRIMGDNISIYEIVPTNDGNFYFSGYDNTRVIGKMTPTGTVIWQENADYFVRDITNINGYLITLGINDYGNNGVSYISLHSPNGGKPISQLAYSDFVNIRFNKISGNFVTGRVETNGIIYPIIVKYKLVGDKLEKELTKVYTEQPNHTIGYISENYVEFVKLTSGNFAKPVFSDVKISRLNPNSLLIEWQRVLNIPNSVQTYVGNMIRVNNFIYVCGSIDVNENEKPVEGGYWDDGYLACYDLNGNLRYTKSYKLSIVNDYYTSMSIDNNIAYLFGYASHHYKSATDRTFGYGLITKVDATNGNLIEHRIIGDEKYQSGFNHGILFGSRLYVAGYTNYYKESANFQGWLVDLPK